MSAATDGYFIVFEGGEGAGKSTQESLLAQSLTDLGHEVVRTREPGGTPAAEIMRDLVLNTKYEGLDARAEALLFAAARGDHVSRVVKPARALGQVVICDRFIDSSVAYQGYGRDLGPERIRDLSLWATYGLVPDLTVVLDISPKVGLSRVLNPDRLEAEPLEYHESVRQAYVTIAALEPERYLVVDASGEIQAIAAAILGRVLEGLG
ncbi:MAG: dTMP kinase [bacterium]|nr:dTMP kinase [bacterium]